MHPRVETWLDSLITPRDTWGRIRFAAVLVVVVVAFVFFMQWLMDWLHTPLEIIYSWLTGDKHVQPYLLSRQF